MTHNITLNFDTDLFFHTVNVPQPEIITKTAYSTAKSAFTTIERSRQIGFVDVTASDDERIATVDGESTTNDLTFFATRYTDEAGQEIILWEVYDFEEIDLEGVPTDDIPDAIVDMLLEL